MVDPAKGRHGKWIILFQYRVEDQTPFATSALPVSRAIGVEELLCYPQPFHGSTASR